MRRRARRARAHRQQGLTLSMITLYQLHWSHRFRFLHNRTDRVFEQLEQCLLIAAERLSSRRYSPGRTVYR